MNMATLFSVAVAAFLLGMEVGRLQFAHGVAQWVARRFTEMDDGQVRKLLDWLENDEEDEDGDGEK